MLPLEKENGRQYRRRAQLAGERIVPLDDDPVGELPGDRLKSPDVTDDLVPILQRRPPQRLVVKNLTPRETHGVWFCILVVSGGRRIARSVVLRGNPDWVTIGSTEL